MLAAAVRGDGEHPCISSAIARWHGVDALLAMHETCVLEARILCDA